MVWSATKQEYNDSIANMGPRWAGEIVIDEDIDEALIWL